MDYNIFNTPFINSTNFSLTSLQCELQNSEIACLDK